MLWQEPHGRFSQPNIQNFWFRQCCLDKNKEIIQVQNYFLSAQSSLGGAITTKNSKCQCSALAASYVKFATYRFAFFERDSNAIKKVCHAIYKLLEGMC